MSYGQTYKQTDYFLYNRFDGNNNLDQVSLFLISFIIDCCCLCGTGSSHNIFGCLASTFTSTHWFYGNISAIFNFGLFWFTLNLVIFGLIFYQSLFIFSLNLVIFGLIFINLYLFSLNLVIFGLIFINLYLFFGWTW